MQRSRYSCIDPHAHSQHGHNVQCRCSHSCIIAALLSAEHNHTNIDLLRRTGSLALFSLKYKKLIRFVTSASLQHSQNRTTYGTQHHHWVLVSIDFLLRMDFPAQILFALDITWPFYRETLTRPFYRETLGA